MARLSLGLASGLVAVALLTGGCGRVEGQTFTLYRNSPLDHSMRVHWATFDVSEPGSYNLDNCEMAALLLNANLSRMNENRNPLIGFWCEKGPYDPNGAVPSRFPEAFPVG